MKRALDLSDTASVTGWLDALSTALADARDAAIDAVRSRRARALVVVGFAMGSRRPALVGLDVDAQRADAEGDGFAPRIAGGSRSRMNKNAPRTTASATATRMNGERVVLDPRIEGGGIEGGAISDLGGGVLFGMPTGYNKGAAASLPAPGGKGAKGRLRCRVADEDVAMR